MGFTFVQDPTFTADVKLTVAAQPEPAVVQFTFRHLGGRALESWVSSSKGRDDAEFLGEVIVDWSGVADAAGPVAYSVEALARLLDQLQPASREIFRQYHSALRESRLGN